MAERKILGLTEEIVINKRKIIARIDSGATMSSIDKEVVDELKLGPPIREKLVKQAQGRTSRPVIKEKVKIKGLELNTEFNVAKRSHMKFRVLIGQNTLQEGKFLIDPLKK